MNDTTPAEEDLALDPWVGHMLNGRYRLVAAIGAGGMGVVYRAWDLANDGYVVVKMPKRELLGEPIFLQRFEQELSALRALSHPAVVPVIDVGNEQGTPYAVMPYLAGGSLKQRRLFTQEGQAAPEPPANLWRWLPAVAKALDFVHASGYVHRDVKPDNVLFDGPGKPFLSDFGVAKIVLQAEDETASRGLTGTGMALGTPAYMAPELISGTKPSPQVDQYALAVTIYELLAARKPFDGPTPAAVILAHVTGNAPALASLLPGLPAALSDAVARGMAREPADRFGSCVEFATAALATMPRPSAAEKLQLMCPQCSRLLNVKPEWAGKQGNCPKCKSAMAIGADLKSLWLQGDRLGMAPAGETVPVRVLGPTPSLPVAIPKPTRPTKPPEPQSVIEVLKEQFLGSKILKGVAAALVAFAFIAVALPFVGGGKDAGKPPKSKTKATASAKAPAPGDGTADATEPDRRVASGSESTTTAADSVRGRTEIREGSGGRPAGPQQEEIAKQSLQPPAPSPQAAPPAAAVAAGGSPADRSEPTASSVAANVNDAKQKGDRQSLPNPPAAQQPEAEPETNPRKPVPEAEELKKAVATIQEAYENQYDEAKDLGSLGALAGDLIDAASGSQDTISRYALLREAERLLEEDLDLDRALNVVAQRAEIYAEDSHDSQAKLFERLEKRKSTSPRLFEQAVDAAKRSLDECQFDKADAAIDLADSVFKANKNAAQRPPRGRRGGAGMQNAGNPLPPQNIKALEDSLKQLRSMASERKKSYRIYTDALEDLERSPDDAKAHGIVGKYLCFERAAWPEGLPHLNASDLATISALAKMQTEIDGAGRKDTARVFEIAGQWWELAENAPPSALTDRQRESIRKFAGRMYDEILVALKNDLDIKLAEKRRCADTGEADAEKTPFAELAAGSPKDLEDNPNTQPQRKGLKTSLANELTARLDPDLRKQMLEKYGGSKESEAAIDRGLEWLLAHQLPDGGWSFDMAACPGCGGQCPNSGQESRKRDRAGATGLALLAFYGRGHTHYQGPAKTSLQKGVNFLATLVVAGRGQCYQEQGGMYSQGVATLALSEAYALTKDRRLKDPTQLALNFIMEAQDPTGGGWRYQPREPGDTSASGWQFMALKAGATAGLFVKPQTGDRFAFFLDSVQERDGAAYGYVNRGSGGATTAVGVLCRTYMGWPLDDPRILTAADNLVRWQGNDDLYFNYYCTQLFRRLAGTHWVGWNPGMRDMLLRTQVQGGHAAGSWHEGVAGGHGAGDAGRLYCTAIATMILESYYRYVSPRDLSE
jgi:serine/threonine protein kinase